MCGGLLFAGEDAGAFQRDVDAQILPGQLGGIALGRHLDLALAEADRVALDGDSAGEAAVDRVKAEQMCISLDRAEIVDADHLDILAAGLGDRPQDVAADAAKPIDRDADCHLSSPLMTSNDVCHPRDILSSRGLFGRTPGSAGRERKIWSLGSPFSRRSQPSPQSLQGGANRSLGCNAEM